MLGRGLHPREDRTVPLGPTVTRDRYAFIRVCLTCIYGRLYIENGIPSLVIRPSLADMMWFDLMRFASKHIDVDMLIDEAGDIVICQR